MTVDENLACDTCGRFGAIDLGERKLCPDCHATCGAGCAGEPARSPWAHRAASWLRPLGTHPGSPPRNPPASLDFAPGSANLAA